MSLDLEKEIKSASEKAPLVVDPDNIPGVVDQLSLDYTTRSDLVKAGKKHLSIYWRLVLGILVLIPVAAFLIGVNAPRGSAPLILPVLSVVWIITAGVGVLGFFGLLIRNKLLKREAEKTREYLVRAIGLARKNSGYFSLPQTYLWQAYVLKDALAILDADSKNFSEFELEVA